MPNNEAPATSAASMGLAPAFGSTPFGFVAAPRRFIQRSQLACTPIAPNITPAGGIADWARHGLSVRSLQEFHEEGQQRDFFQRAGSLQPRPMQSEH